MPDDSLTTLESSGLIRLARMEPDIEYLFKHALVQEAAYDSLLRADRKQLHAKVAQILELKFSDRLDELLGTITYHYNQAEEWGKALDYAARAATQFKLNFANDEALAYYEIALASAEKILSATDTKEAADIKQKMFSILSDRHGVWTLMGNFDKTLLDLNQMVLIARELQDDARLADALNGLGYFYINTSTQDPQPVLLEALAIKRRLGDKAGQADSLNTLGAVLVGNGGVAKAMEAYVEARQIYESIGSADGIARSDWSIGVTEYELLGHYERARSRFENSIAICRKLGMKNLECGGYMMLGANYIRMGEIEKGESTLAIALDLATQIGDFPAQGWIYLYQSWAHREKGMYARALQLIDQALEISISRNITNLVWYAHYSLTQCKLLSGAIQEGFGLAKQVYDLSKDVHIWIDIKCRSTAILAEAAALNDENMDAERFALEALKELDQFGPSVVAEVAGVYLSCYKALRNSKPDRAFQSIKLAYKKVIAQSQTFADKEAQDHFLGNVRMNREVIQIWSEVNSK